MLRERKINETITCSSVIYKPSMQKGLKWFSLWPEYSDLQLVNQSPSQVQGCIHVLLTKRKIANKIHCNIKKHSVLLLSETAFLMESLTYIRVHIKHQQVNLSLWIHPLLWASQWASMLINTYWDNPHGRNIDWSVFAYNVASITNKIFQEKKKTSYWITSEYISGITAPLSITVLIISVFIKAE